MRCGTRGSPLAMRQPGRRSRPSSQRRLTPSRSPASPRRVEPPGASGAGPQGLAHFSRKTVSVLDPSGDNIRGPFERVETPSEAVDRLVRLYEEATQALHGAVERFLKNGEPPSAATRALF